MPDTPPPVQPAMSLPRHPQPILFRAQPLTPDEAEARLDHAARLAVEAETAGVLLAWGGVQVPAMVPTGVTLAPLPAAWMAADRPGLLLDGDGRMASPAWKKQRAAALLALFAGMVPRLIVLDGAPSLFRFELRPLLEMARRRRPGPMVSLWPPDAVAGPELAPLLADQPACEAAAIAAL